MSVLYLCKHYNVRPFYTWFIIPAMIYVPSLNETVYEATGINQTLPCWGVILRSQTHGRTVWEGSPTLSQWWEARGNGIKAMQSVTVTATCTLSCAHGSVFTASVVSINSQIQQSPGGDPPILGCKPFRGDYFHHISSLLISHWSPVNPTQGTSADTKALFSLDLLAPSSKDFPSWSALQGKYSSGSKI